MRWIVLLILLLAGCTTSDTRVMMGTDVYIQGNGFGAAFDEIARVEGIMSTFVDSEVSRLNFDGTLENPSEDLLFVLLKTKYYYELSDGAFDPTIEPLLKLYSHSFGVLGRPPSDQEILDKLKLVDFKKVKIENSVFMQPGMAINLGGIAKGYAIDQAISKMKGRALVNAGGDMRAVGSWKIALQNPRNPDDYISLINLEDMAIATSGDYERYFDNSLKAHHIMNPKTGKSALELISVTVIAPTAIDADTLATTVFILGRENGLKLIENEEAEALVITADREIFRSTGFDKYEI